MIKHLFRPSILIALSAAVVVGAVAVVFQRLPAQGRPQPLPVGAGEQEIVWLYTATNAPSWERFVTAVRRTAERLRADHPGLTADESAAFPEQTTAVPQVALAVPGGPRFVFRWYKLTSDWKTKDWIDALLSRRPPPLAIIGGSSSDAARELAAQLEQRGAELPEAHRPLLLLTTATADRVAPLPGGDRGEAGSSGSPLVPADDPEAAAGVSLTRLYPGRTFRFCFTNRQMATAVTRFIWSQDDLRPDSDPVYMVMWNDDSYSRDLIEGFWKALQPVVAQSIANEWAWLHFGIASRNWPPLVTTGIFPVDRLPLGENDPGCRFSLDLPPTPQIIDSSVGSFGTPNRYEAKVARDMLDLLQEQDREQRRPLLIVTGQTLPSRRFLRALIRPVPKLAGRVVVATGDAIAFNTVYRDRQVAWNIQDLPFPLVFFCHHNPIDRDAGFRPSEEEPQGDDDPATTSTGTEDVLLYADIVEALLQAGAPAGAAPCASAAELGERFADLHLHGDRLGPGPEGVRLFGRHGQRRSGTGEHVVCLRPVFNDTVDRLLPQATIEVWAWRRREGGPGGGQVWHRCGEPLTVLYGDLPPEKGAAHGE